MFLPLTGVRPMPETPYVLFPWRSYKFTVRLKDGATVYRDSAHIGGPWSSVVDTLKNSSVALTFRRQLAKAERELLAKPVLP
jgi:hypothetical protein